MTHTKKFIHSYCLPCNYVTKPFSILQRVIKSQRFCISFGQSKILGLNSLFVNMTWENPISFYYKEKVINNNDNNNNKIQCFFLSKIFAVKLSDLFLIFHI